MTPKEKITALIRQHMEPTVKQLLGYVESAEALATVNPAWLPFIEEARKLEGDFDALATAGDLIEIKSRMESCLLLWSIALGRIQVGGCIN